MTGLAFGSLLVGAVAQRFVAPEVEAETERLEITDAQIASELNELAQRVQRLDAAIRHRQVTRPD